MEDHGKYEEIIRIVGMIVRESTKMKPPHHPLFPNGNGMAEIDYHYLVMLGEAYREFYPYTEGRATNG